MAIGSLPFIFFAVNSVLAEDFWVQHMARLAGGESENVFDHNPIILFVAFSCNVAEMGRAGDVGHLDQRLIRADRLFVINIHRGKAGAPGLERIDQSTARDKSRAAGVDEQCRGVHAPAGTAASAGGEV